MSNPSLLHSMWRLDLWMGNNNPIKAIHCVTHYPLLACRCQRSRSFVRGADKRLPETKYGGGHIRNDATQSETVFTPHTQQNESAWMPVYIYIEEIDEFVVEPQNNKLLLHMHYSACIHHALHCWCSPHSYLLNDMCVEVYIWTRRCRLNVTQWK